MSINQPGFSVNDEYKDSVNQLFSDVESLEKVQNDIPPDVALKVINHPDVSIFVETGDLLGGVTLPGILGSYKVYTEDFILLCTVNLHSGVFGSMFPEICYFSKMDKWEILYVNYNDFRSNSRSIQIIKKDESVYVTNPESNLAKD
jgi:hypothetical protein